MSDDLKNEIQSINLFLDNMAKVSGKYPKKAIEVLVEKWFVDGSNDIDHVHDCIFFIKNKKYQQTAQKHLRTICVTGLVHGKESLTQTNTENAEPAKRNPSPLYWSNDGSDDQFLGEFSSPKGMVFSFVKMLAVFAVIVFFLTLLV